ncbi:hypothetical protein Acr_24g0006670 [Actinidia rufa]|uniref:CCHC-type domain-containing protein n=1 Tax=Actinidia rufa TaxID=165716 RepID=A0A7J0GUF9_9ERIC|nr:hypothetical protein Acr_24g0006670 [Actinidia rufa]
MPPRRGRGRRGAAEPEDRVDRIERILEGLVQVVHDVHNNNNHDDAPQQPAMPSQEPERCHRVFEVLPCTDEQKVVFATFMFEGAALIWWQLKKPLEPLWLWPRFLEVFNEEYFPEMVRDQKIQEFLNLKQGNMIVVVYNAKVYGTITICPSHCVDGISQGEKKRIGGNVRRGQSSKRQSSGSSSGNSSAQQRNIVSQGSSRSNELPTCPTCQKKHWGECRMGSRGCYGCGQEGHQIRDCPMRKRIQGAGTSASASVQQPPTERGNNQPRQGRAFALVPGNTPATTSLVSGILPICGQPAHILMDSGSTHSFVSHSFEHYLTTSPVSLEYELSVSLPSGDSMLCDRVYSSCEIRVNDVPMYVNLIPLEMHGF